MACWNARETPLLRLGAPVRNSWRSSFAYPTFWLSIILVFSMGVARAQDYLAATGAPTFTTSIPVELGFINAGNGNLHIEIPLVSIPQRANLSFSAKLVYDSRIWKVVGYSPKVWQPTNVINSQGGWRFITSVDKGTVEPNQDTELCSDDIHQYTSRGPFVWTQSDGSQHTFQIYTIFYGPGCGGISVSSGDAVADDSSGYHMFVTNYFTPKIYANDGTIVYGPGFERKDTNGNYFSIANGNLVDTTGRTAFTTTVNGNTTTYDFVESRGGTSEFKVTTSTISANTNFGQTGVTECTTNCTITVITRLDLPLAGMSYVFDYDSGTTPGKFGLLKTITLPTGGVISYTFTTFADAYGNRNRWAYTRTSGGQSTYNPQVITTCSQGGVNCQQKVTVTKPSNDQTVYTFTLNNGAWNTQADYYNGSVAPSNLVKTVTNTYDLSNSCPPGGCIGARYITTQKVTTSLPSVGGTTLTRKTEYTYDSPPTANVTQIREWNFYTGTAPGTPDRKTDRVYLTGSSYSAKNILNRVTSVTTRSGADAWLGQTNISYDSTTLTSMTGIVHHDDGGFGISNTVRGNSTVISQLVVSGASCPSANCFSTTLTYDTTGQITASQDSNSNSTSIGYADQYYTDNGSNPPAVFTPPAPTNAYPTSVTLPIVGATSSGYYFYTGKQAYVKDQNNADTYFHYIDPMDRLTHTYGSQIAAGRPWTFTQYNSVSQQDVYESVSDTTPSPSCIGCRHRQISVDMWGRATKSSLLNDPDGSIATDKAYDTTGRVQSISHPYRSVSDSTYGLETNAYDGLDRLTQVTHQDGSSAQTFYGAAVSSNGGIATKLCSGLGYPILTKDEAGKKLQTWMDGLGRLVEVDEPDSGNNLTIVTCNTYNLLDNLTQVVQQNETRTYLYDGLSRLTQSTVPETGPSTSPTGTTYFYYTTSTNTLCSGDPRLVCRRTDPRSTTTTYTYDALNRLTQKAYSDGVTATVKYGYDAIAPSGCTPPSLTITNPKGHRTSMCDGSGSTSWSYDAAGNLLTEKRMIGTVTKSVSYQYNLDRSRTTVTYPSNRVVTYGYDVVGRAISAIDTANSINYVKEAHYTAHAKIASLKNGVTGTFAGITTTNTFNNRLQPASLSASTSSQTIYSLLYTYPQSGNNGTVTTITNALSSSRTQTFTYDNLNRIQTAQSQATAGADCWGESFGYDTLGNLNTRAVTKCSAESWTNNSANNKNQIAGFCYDSAGNLTNQGACGSPTYSYDGENEMVSALGVTHTYDGDNLRVKKSSGTLYWRGGGIDVLAETDLSGGITKEFVFLAGRQSAMRDAQAGSVTYYFLDHLGSVRVAAQQSGTVCYDADYYPFGGEMVKVNTCPPESKFATYDRDAETGLDYAVFRHYSPSMGRFVSVDRLNGILADPQSLNRYLYVSDRVLHFRDPLGLCHNHNGGGGEHGGQSPEQQLQQYAQEQLGQVGQSLTDCQAMVNIFAKAFDLFGSTSSAATALFSTLTELNPSDPMEQRPDARASTVGWVGENTFGDTGFNPVFQDSSNQVRHFTGFFYIGAMSAQGGITGAAWAIGGRYRAENDTPQDRMLGIAGLDVGRAFGEGTLSKQETKDTISNDVCQQQ